MIVNCIKCTKEFYCNPARAGKRKHCSYNCKNPPILITCKMCNKVVRVRPSKTITAEFCSKSCASSNRTGVNGTNWKGGSIDSNGYKRISTKKEHRIIMETILGRPLLEIERVHHLDNNKLNNDPSNLIVLDDSSHAKLHWQTNWKHRSISGRQ